MAAGRLMFASLELNGQILPRALFVWLTPRITCGRVRRECAGPARRLLLTEGKTPAEELSKRCDGNVRQVHTHVRQHASGHFPRALERLEHNLQPSHTAGTSGAPWPWRLETAP